MKSLKLSETPLHAKMFVEAAGAVGPDGKNDRYEIVYGQVAKHADDGSVHFSPDPARTIILKFQSGDVDEVGVNGISDEVLFAVLRDRCASAAARLPVPFGIGEGKP